MDCDTYGTFLLIYDSFYYDFEIITKLFRYVKMQPINKNLSTMKF